MVKLTIRIDLSPTVAVGPGKVQLLESIEETGSISAAGRTMNMSYRRAWLLVDELNKLFKERVATTAHGGRTGGGAKLTPFGRKLVRHYRALEAKAHAATAAHLAELEAALHQRAPRAAKRRPIVSRRQSSRPTP
ncbi:MAG: LysR family transcriptional regulator [Alphaproteobacteria bacterium]|nr:LysR family transcriptional regulator [Alphaproteobacteria bacterium]